MQERPDQPATPDIPAAPGTAPAGTPPTPPPRPGLSASFLTAGWGKAVVGALLTALILLVIAEGILFVAYSAGNAEGGVSLVAKLGGYLFLLFHHVGVVVGIGGLDTGGLLPGAGRATVAFALMGGAILAGLLLARAGRAVADQTPEQTGWVRGASGAKVALPYALLCLVLSFVLKTELDRGAVAGVPTAEIHPSYLAAFLWPLAIGLVAGFFGGMRAGAEPVGQGSVWRQRVSAAVAGGWRMIFIGVVLGVVGFYLWTLFNPEARYYTSFFDEGLLVGLVLIALNILILPNIGAWVLFPAMGACVEAKIAVLNVCLLSYSHFPGETTGAASSGFPIPDFGSAPVGYFVFLLVPLIAVLWGGMRAADRGAVPSRSEGAVVGALAGVAYAIFSLGLLALSLITVRASGDVGALGAGGAGRIGPDPIGGFLLALAWGVIGGAIGGYIRGGRTGVTRTEAATPPPPSWTGT